MSRTSLVRAVALAAGFGLLGAASAVPASAQITFTPFVGSFYAVSKYIDLGNGSGQSVTAEQSNTAVFGARLGIGLGPVFGVEGSVGFAKSNVLLKLAGGFTDTLTNQVFDVSTDFSGNVLTGTLRMLVKPRRSNLRGFAGVAVVNHSGDAWDPQDFTDYGASFGFGLRASVTPRFALDIAAEAIVYSFDPDGDGGFDSRTQADLFFTVGVPISLSR